MEQVHWVRWPETKDRGGYMDIATEMEISSKEKWNETNALKQDNKYCTQKKVKLLYAVSWNC